ncbi:MFS transporter [Mycolicibacterium baixiangningiae]|uniref:MFS transporter n=1 Tax=Mycolicibacterium baixiangningiae TaxID=2761578 RepID=UPI0018687E8D|nr:MFS transporter [Mycolicibacterium baixiangningiae]
MADTLARPEQPTDPSLAALSKGRRVWLLVVACMGVSLVISSMIGLNTALSDIAIATSATQTQLTWVVDGYTLVLACLLLPAGAVGDRYGRRGALLIGLAIFSVASVAPLMFDSPTQIILARAVAGAGAAFVMPATLSLLTAAYPKSERNKAVGIWAAVAGSATVIGFLGSGLLLNFWSWQSIFWAFAIAGAAMIVLTCTVPSSRETDAAPLDWWGAGLIGAAVAVFVFGVIEAPARGWTDPGVLICIAVGVVLAVVFGFVELRRRFPLLDVRLFGRPDFATGAVGVTLLFFANFGFFFVVIQYIQLVMGYTPLRTAVAIAPLAAPLLVFGVLTPWYLPRMGLRLTVFSGLLILSAGLLFMQLLENGSSFWDLTWPMLVMSTGIGLCTAPTTSAIMGAVPDDKQGVASAVNDATREIGAALGIAVAGSIFAAQYADALSPGLSAFPPEIRGPATDSPAEALEISEKMGPQGAQLADLAESAFLQAMDSSLFAIAAVVAVAAVFVAIWAPGRDGQQLRIVRRLSGRARARNVARHRS